MEMDDLGSGEGWLFHGTDHLSSTWILSEGFRSFREETLPNVYWGSANIAATFAEKAASSDSPPVLLAAPTRSVLASGTPCVDQNALEAFPAGRGEPFRDWERLRPADGEPVTDWRQSYLSTGCVLMRGCRPVDGIKRYDISRFALHPDAPESRARRLGTSWLVQPHPAETLSLEVDAEAELFPRTMDCVMAGLRGPGLISVALANAFAP